MCFSLGWIEQLCIWLIILWAVVAIIKLLVPMVASIFGSYGGTVVAIINIVLWAIVAIMVIKVIFMLLSCLLGMGGGLHLLR